MEKIRNMLKNKIIFILCLFILITLFVLILTLNGNEKKDNNTLTTTKINSKITTTVNSDENDKDNLESENKTTTKNVNTSSQFVSTTQSTTKQSATTQSTTKQSATTQSTTKQSKKYIVSFNSDGGSSIENKEIYENQTFNSLPITKKKDYEFIGWYLNNKKFSVDTKVNSNITLLAKFTYLNAEKQLQEGYPAPDMAYSYSTDESAEKYLDLLNALWDEEMVPRLNEGFYSQSEIDSYLEWIDNKAYEFREVLECNPGFEYMCE